MARLPNCFLVGAPKAGTTSLYHYLEQHPQVYMSPIKEPNFFSTEIRIENFHPALRKRVARDARSLRKFLSGPMDPKRFGGIVADWEDYLRLFANAGDEMALGEASVCYLWSATAAERIAASIPNARILVMLRNPVDRAFSDYLHGLGAGHIRWSFREHIQRNLSHRSSLFCVHYPFLELGLYAAQLSEYLARFGPNVWVGFYENFQNRPLETVQSIFRFLGVSPEFSPDMTRRYLEARVPRTAGRVTPTRPQPLVRRCFTRRPGSIRMDPADRDYLVGFYREDIRKLAALLGRDLEAWLGQPPGHY